MSTPHRRIPLVLMPLIALWCAGGCDDETKRSAAALTGGNPDRGEALIVHYGCGSRPALPSVPAADALLVPPPTPRARQPHPPGPTKDHPAHSRPGHRDPPRHEPTTPV